MTLQKLKQLPELVVLAASIVLGAVFFSLTDPKIVPPAVLMAGFLLLFISLFSVLRLVFRMLRLKERLGPVHYNGALVVASTLPVVLLALQSLGQLTVRDVVTLVVLYVVGYFYVSRLNGHK